LGKKGRTTRRKMGFKRKNTVSDPDTRDSRGTLAVEGKGGKHRLCHERGGGKLKRQKQAASVKTLKRKGKAGLPISRSVCRGK